MVFLGMVKQGRSHPPLFINTTHLLGRCVMPETSIPIQKQCRKCLEYFPATREYFAYDVQREKRGFDPLTPQCKTCRNGGYLAQCMRCQKSLQGLRRKAYCSLECRVLHSLGGIGAKHGRLTVVQYQGQKGQADASSLVLCLCDCGNYTTLEHSNILSGGTKSCGCLRRDRPKGKDHPGWKGGRNLDKQGYVRLHMPEHPNAYASDRTVLEHVYVMSTFLGRPLRPGENVHHKNGIRDDNRLENLELWVKSQPAGQRIEDLVAHAQYILKTYADDARKLAQRDTAPGHSQLSFLGSEVGEIDQGPSV